MGDIAENLTCGAGANWASEVVVDIIAEHLQEYQSLLARDPDNAPFFQYKVNDWLGPMQSRFFAVGASAISSSRFAPLVDTLVMVNLTATQSLARSLLWSSSAELQLLAVSLNCRLGNTSVCDDLLPALTKSTRSAMKPWALLEQASCLQDRRQFDRAEGAINDVWQMSRYSPTNAFQSLVLGMRGSILHDIGDFDAAEESFNASIALAGRIHLEQLNDYALLKIDMFVYAERRDESSHFLRQSVAILEEVGRRKQFLRHIGTHPYYQRHLHNVAIAYDYLKWDDSYRWISHQIKETSVNHRVFARAVENEGIFEWRRRHFDLAEIHLNQALRIRSSEFNCVGDLALSFRSLGW